jgi:hypothetical protein
LYVIGGRGVAANDIQAIHCCDQRVAAACVTHRRELDPGRTIETEKSRAVALECVTSCDVYMIVEGSSGHVIQTEW